MEGKERQVINYTFKTNHLLDYKIGSLSLLELPFDCTFFKFQPILRMIFMLYDIMTTTFLG